MDKFFNSLEKNINKATRKTTLDKLEKAGQKHVNSIKNSYEKNKARQNFKVIKQKIKQKKRKI